MFFDKPDEYPIPEIPDKEYESLSQEQQHAYNQKIKAKRRYNEAKEDYDKSLSMGWPVLLIFMGIILTFVFSVIGLVLIIAAVIWAIIRLVSRGHLYQKYRDSEADLKAELK
jgi:uncharacterized membrane protein